MTLSSKHSRITELTIMGGAITLGMLIAGFLTYKGISMLKGDDRYVTVKGLAEQTVKSDRGTWEISSRVSGNDLSALYAQFSSDSQKIRQFALRKGFSETEIMPSLPRVTDLHVREYNNGSLAPERYLVEYTVVVNSTRVDELASLNTGVGELIQQGVSVNQSQTKYYLDQFNTLRPKLVGEAMQNATYMAKTFTETTGSSLKGIRQANQGVIRVTSPDSSPNNEYDDGTSSLFKSLRVVSTAQFYIQ